MREQIEEIFEDLTTYQANVQAFAGFSCIEGCGACCRSPAVEATPGEMLPLASQILSDENWSEVLERLKKAEKPCIFYQPHSSDGSMGRCSVYNVRPAVCRLFGSSLQRKKGDGVELSTCSQQRSLYADKISEANTKIQKLEHVVTMQDFGQRLKMTLAGHPSLGRSLPINQATAQAIEYLGLRRTLTHT